MDNADEFYIPYLYAKNAPIKFIDPDGNRVFIGKKLWSMPGFQSEIGTSEFKRFLGLFVGGGPLDKYDVTLKYEKVGSGRFQIFKNNEKLQFVPGGIFERSTSPLIHVVDKKANYSFDIFLQPDGSGFNIWDNTKDRGARTLPHEITHVLYTVFAILKDGKVYVDTQHHTGMVPVGEENVNKFLEELKALGYEPIEIENVTLDSFDGVVDDRNIFDKISDWWNGLWSKVMKKIILLFLLFIFFGCQNEINYVDLEALPLDVNLNSFKKSGFEFEEVKLDYDYGYKVYYIKKDSVVFKYNDYIFKGSFFAVLHDGKSLDSFDIICDTENINDLIRKYGKFERFELKNGNDLCFNEQNHLMFIINYTINATRVFKY